MLFLKLHIGIFAHTQYNWICFDRNLEGAAGCGWEIGETRWALSWLTADTWWWALAGSWVQVLFSAFLATQCRGQGDWGSGARLPWFQFQLCCVLLVWLWISFLTSLWLISLLYQKGIIIVCFFQRYVKMKWEEVQGILNGAWHRAIQAGCNYYHLY